MIARRKKQKILALIRTSEGLLPYAELLLFQILKRYNISGSLVTMVWYTLSLQKEETASRYEGWL
jgi:hypothetical protein